MTDVPDNQQWGPTSALRVLLIEDNADDSELIGRQIVRHAPDTMLTPAPDLASGLAKMAEEDFDVVVLDLAPPDSEGVDTYRRLRGEHPMAAVVVLTGSLSEDVGIRAVQSGAQDYIPKAKLDGNALARAVYYAAIRQELTTQLERERAALKEELNRLAALLEDRVSGASMTQNAKDAAAKRFEALLREGLRARNMMHPDPAAALRSMAAELAASRAGPAELMEIMSRGVRTAVSTLGEQERAAMMQEARLRMLQTMAFLAGAYRSRADG